MLALYNTGRILLGKSLRQHITREHGVTIVEYAIMLALIAIAVALATPTYEPQSWLFLARLSL